MNIYEIAKEAGVSIATVSRVLNNSNKVSEKSRQKIMSIIEANNYNPTRPGKKHTPSKIVGIVCNSIKNPRTASIVEKISTDLHNLNYKTELINCQMDINEKRHAIQYFSEQDISAIVIEGTDFLAYDHEQNNYILSAANNVPIIMLDAYMEHPNIYSILCDNSRYILSLAEDYIKKGKSNIILLFSAMSSYCQTIIEAFSHAYSVHNIETTPEQIHLCQNGYKDAYDYISKLIIDNKPIDAIIAINDSIALGVLNAAKNNDVAIPECFDIISYGDTYLSNMCTPPISSVNCKYNEICNAAVNTLISISNKANIATRITFAPELIKRGTSK